MLVKLSCESHSKSHGHWLYDTGLKCISLSLIRLPPVTNCTLFVCFNLYAIENKSYIHGTYGL